MWYNESVGILGAEQGTMVFFINFVGYLEQELERRKSQ